MAISRKKKSKALEIAFKDSLLSFSSALEAGYSIENCIHEVSNELRLIYPASSGIIKEYEYMGNQIRNNVSVETVFKEFANRTMIEDIVNFSEILVTAKKTGGDLVKIIKSTASAISEKTEVMQEIQTSISGKKYEAMVMKSVPYLMLLYFRLFSPGYLSPLYERVQGIVVMTVLLLIYLGANALTERIVSIEV